ncbi:MmgE/PrpD family protein [Shouchella shacheensis]|uniref:MmgE/PrpD family protein n=1 Tax=Shouchella shacheensis TaxID=1649580 RepID=UPI0007403250|nr:MmgE/PrpD family protein [Shouchella shacheensis]
MLSEKLARFIVDTHYEAIPEDVIAFTKGCFLDWLGSCVAGASQPPVQMLKEFVEEMGGNPQASTVTGGKTSVYQAAFLNGASSHIVELDDIHRGSIVHAATVVIPAALAAAEYKGKSGTDLLTAIIVGYDVAFRIGEAVSPSHYRHWHNTATCGTFGAAAAAAKLLDLTVDQTVHALGSAGTQAAGLWEFIEDGAMSKQLHPAKAGMDGLIAALTAKKGFTAAIQILEGGRGFFEAMSDEADATKITAGLGDEFKITENSFKIHASCRHTHQPVDLSLQFVKSAHLNVKDIKQLTVKTYQSAKEIAGYTAPKTIYAAKFSIAFCTALALTKGKAGLEDFNEANLWDEEIRSLMNKINVIVDPEIEGAYPEQWGTEIELTLAGGQVKKANVHFPKGDPENPVSLRDLKEKFAGLAGYAGMDEKLINDWSQQVLRFEETERITDWFAPIQANASSPVSPT